MDLNKELVDGVRMAYHRLCNANDSDTEFAMLLLRRLLLRYSPGINLSLLKIEKEVLSK